LSMGGMSADLLDGFGQLNLQNLISFLEIWRVECLPTSLYSGGHHAATPDRASCYPGPRDPLRVACIPCTAAGEESPQDRCVITPPPAFVTRLEAAIGVLAGAEHFGLD